MQTIKDEEHWERGDFLKLINSLSKDDAAKRHEIRYALFRIKTEIDGGVKADKPHHAIGEMVQQFKGAGAPAEFASEWDVGAVSPDIVVVKRMWSIYQEHDQLMRRVAVPIERNDTPETLARKVAAMEKREAKRFKREQKRTAE
jgi:hypothetical protein